MSNLKFNPEASLKLASELGKLAIEHGLISNHMDPKRTAKEVADFILAVATELSNPTSNSQE